MLEIVFTNGRVGVEVVKIIGVEEKNRLSSEHLSDEECKNLNKVAKQNKFSGKQGTFLELNSPKGKMIIMGLGKNPNILELRKLGGMLYNKVAQTEVVQYLVSAISGSKLSKTEIAHNIAFGVLLGSYRFDKYFTQKKPDEYPSLERVIFKLEQGEKVTEEFKPYAALANAVRYGRDLCNEPANYLTPQVFADDIQRLSYLGLDIEILGQKELEEKGFNLLLAVAQGSVKEPKVAVVKWKGNPKSEKWDLGLVGKGVTFDSGGISIKPWSGMEEMKTDMTGASVVVASLKAAALQCVRKNIIGIVGLVENMPSGNATRPGDVVTSMSGQTVEVIYTDAEGRLVLADCLWYLQDQYGAKKIIDIATLTGAIMRALGGEYAGLFSNNDKLAKDLLSSANDSDEKLWQMPMNEGFNKKINSDIADMKNIGGVSGGGSTAACFLRRFIQKDTKWAHLDIAGMENEKKGTPIIPKGATAFGVRLLNDFINHKI
ncbi:MAG: leucyl aminopeptidase [Alphaproteobacteria bacterium]|nr:leucyl aminopeptidase [Alphaproteobacteria bacterium]